MDTRQDNFTTKTHFPEHFGVLQLPTASGKSIQNRRSFCTHFRGPFCALLEPLGGRCRAVPGNMATQAPPLKEGALSEWLNVLFECSLWSFSGALSAVSGWRVMEGS